MIPGIVAGQIRAGSSLMEYTSVAYSQSSVYSGMPVASAANMQDANTVPSSATGTGTNNGSEWIKADLGASLLVSVVTVGGGTLPVWGTVASYLNGAVIQYSDDDSSWTTAVTVSDVTDTEPLDRNFPIVPPVSARYWRLSKPWYLATATFRIFGPA